MNFMKMAFPFLAVAAAFAQEPIHGVPLHGVPIHGVPEINLTGGGTAIALFVGAILVIRGRRKRVPPIDRKVTG